MQRNPVSTIALGLCLLLAVPTMVAAVPPGADCANATTNEHPTPGGPAPACDPLLCDVAVSPPLEAIQIGDPFAPATPEQPRFFFDEAGNRFHTRLFSQLRNNGGENVAAGSLRVRFSVKPNAVDINDTVGGFVNITPNHEYVRSSA